MSSFDEVVDFVTSTVMENAEGAAGAAEVAPSHLSSTEAGKLPTTSPPLATTSKSKPSAASTKAAGDWSESEQRLLPDLNSLPSLSQHERVKLVADTASAWKSNATLAGGGILGVLGAVGGAYGGMLLGAAIGSACPVAGTIIGGVVGFLLGGIVSGAAGGGLSGLAGQQLGKWRGATLAQQRETQFQHMAMNSLADRWQQREADGSLLHISPTKKERIAKLADRHRDFEWRMRLCKMLPQIELRSEGKPEPTESLKQSLREGENEAKLARRGCSLARKEDISDIVWRYELEASQACDRLAGGLLGDASGQGAATSERQLAELLVDAQTKVQLCYKVQRAQQRQGSTGGAAALPPRLASPENYYQDNLKKAVARLDLPPGKGAERVQNMLAVDSTARRLYVAALSAADFEHHGTCAEKFCDCFEKAFDACAGFEVEAEGLPYHADHPAMEAVVAVLPRLMAVKDVFSSQGQQSNLPILQPQSPLSEIPEGLELPVEGST